MHMMIEELLTDVECQTCSAGLNQLSSDVWQEAATDHVRRYPGHVVDVRYVRVVRRWSTDAEADHA